jgi:hypothetical protein
VVQVGVAVMQDPCGASTAVRGAVEVGRAICPYVDSICGGPEGSEEGDCGSRLIFGEELGVGFPVAETVRVS